MEERTRRIIQKAKIQDSIIIALYGVTAVALAVAAPNTVQLLKYLEPHIGKRNPRKRMQQAVSRLVSRGLAHKKGAGKNFRLELTVKGRRYAEMLYDGARLHIPKPRRWDERWRIVIFDVWERRRAVRDRLRFLLKRIGFVKLQNSVWAYPYDCEEVIALIRTELRVGKGALYIIADGIEGDHWLREHFGLSK